MTSIKAAAEVRREQARQHKLREEQKAQCIRASIAHIEGHPIPEREFYADEEARTEKLSSKAKRREKQRKKPRLNNIVCGYRTD